MSRSGRAGAGGTGRGHMAPMSDADMAAMVAFTEQSQEDIDAGLVVPMDWLLDSNEELEEVVESSVSPPPLNVDEVEVNPLMAAPQPQPSTSSVGGEEPPSATQLGFQTGSVPVGGIVSCHIFASFPQE